MSGLGQSIFQEGVEEGIEKGIEKGIKAMILDNLEEQTAVDRILSKLQKSFGLTEEKAEQYFRKFAPGEYFV